VEEYAIETKELTKVFGDFVSVDHVSFKVRTGEVFGFLGPNGAGKTTTIRMLCTLSRPTEGSATVAGYDIVKQDGKVRENIGLVSEKMIMYDQLTARENLKIFGKLYDIPDDILKQRVDELLGLVRMEKWADNRIGTFSTGMKQRINVIRTLINRPKILFLDEPTLGLDPQSSREIRDIIQKINEENGTTIILTTHMMEEADRLSDRVAIIDKGKIVALDTPANLKKMVSGSDTTVLELDIPNLSEAIIAGLRSLPDVRAVSTTEETRIKVQAKGENAFDDIVDAVRKAGGKIRTVKNLEPTLEDVFLHITGREVREQVMDKVQERGHKHGPGPRAGSHSRGR